MATDGLFKNQGIGVAVSGVTKNYRTAAEEVHALRETNWEVRTGDAVAIIGPSGCGKITLLNLLGGVDRPTTGKIMVDGKDVAQMNERDLEQHRLHRVGSVLQFFNLVPTITAFENLELPMVMAGTPDAECHARARKLLALDGLEAKGEKRPEDLSERRRTAFGSTCPRPSIPIVLEDGALDTNKEQNRAKNNFCAGGSPVIMTKKTFKDLEAKAEALEQATAGSAHPFTLGRHELVPEDRSAIRANGFHQTSDGAEVHEGTLVRTVSFLMKAKYSGTSGEAVNCNLGKIVNSDIHLVFAAYYCGGHCGYGWLFTLQRGEREWLVTDVRLVANQAR